MIQKAKSKHYIELTVLFSFKIQYIYLVVFDIAHAVNVLRQPKTGIVLMPKIKRYHPCSAFTRLKLK